MWFYLMIVVLILILAWLTRVRERLSTEHFVGTDEEVLNPQEIFRRLRGILDKYDRPDVWNHAAQVMGMDPGQLARQHIGIVNPQ
jgi:hypothetical protein